MSLAATAPCERQGCAKAERLGRRRRGRRDGEKPPRMISARQAASLEISVDRSPRVITPNLMSSCGRPEIDRSPSGSKAACRRRTRCGPARVLLIAAVARGHASARNRQARINPRRQARHGEAGRQKHRRSGTGWSAPHRSPRGRSPRISPSRSAPARAAAPRMAKVSTGSLVRPYLSNSLS